jgi:peptidyl-prolyl cis-trans isomerase SurA
MPSLRLSKLTAAFTLALCLLLCAVSPAAITPAFAQASIKILVNDAPITSFDIKNRTAMLQAFTRGKQGEKDAIEQLVDEKLMLQEAARRNVTVSDEEIAQEFAKRATQARLTPAQFEAAMRQTGIDPETFKDFLRANMAWREIVRARFRSTVNVTEQDVAAALNERSAEGANQAVSEYMLQQILFIVPPGAGKGIEVERENEAKAFRSAFQGCDNAVKQASGRPGVVVKPTVRRAESEIGGDIKEAITSLEVGGVTPPQRVGEGFQIVALCDKRAIAGQSQAADVVRQELSSERGELMARRYLRDLRSDAVIEYR